MLLSSKYDKAVCYLEIKIAFACFLLLANNKNEMNKEFLCVLFRPDLLKH